MKAANICRKPISMFVMVAFTTLLFLWANHVASGLFATGFRE